MGSRRANATIWILLALVITGAVAVWLLVGPSEPLHVGFVGSLSGRDAEHGRNERDGVILAVEMCNRKGGINNLAVNLRIEDDQNRPEMAAAADSRLADAGVRGIVGHMSDATSRAAFPVIRDRQIAMVSPDGCESPPSVGQGAFVRIGPPDGVVAKWLASHMVQTRGFGRVGVVYDESSAAMECWSRCFRRELETLGGQVAGVWTFKSETDPQFPELARRVSTQSADCVLVLANAPDTALLCQYLRKTGNRVPIATSGQTTSGYLIQYGGRAVENMFFLNSFNSESTLPRYVLFRQEFRHRFGYEPGIAAVNGYDAMRLLLLAVGQARTPNETPAALKSIRSFDSLQGSITLDNGGDMRRELFLVTVQNGKFVTINN